MPHLACVCAWFLFGGSTAILCELCLLKRSSSAGYLAIPRLDKRFGSQGRFRNHSWRTLGDVGRRERNHRGRVARLTSSDFSRQLHGWVSERDACARARPTLRCCTLVLRLPR